MSVVGKGFHGVFRVLGSGGAAVDLTASTSETTLATVSVPGGAQGPNGQLRVRATFTHTNSANNKTLRVRLGGLSGTAFTAVVVTTTLTTQLISTIANRNAAASQVGGPLVATGVGSVATAVVTGVIDTTTAQDLVITGQLANSGETLTLESYSVELLSRGN